MTLPRSDTGSPLWWFVNAVKTRTPQTVLPTWLAVWRTLGVDAVLIAGTWQAVLAVDLPLGVRLPAAVALMGAVWAIYLWDHVWDAVRGGGRHDFAQGHKKALLGAGVIAGGCALISAFFLPLSMLAGVVTPSLLLFVYYAVRFLKPSWRGGRDIVLGLAFSAGVVCPLLALGVAVAWAWPGLFALLTANARVCIRVDARLADPADTPVFFWLLCSVLAFVVLGGMQQPAATAGCIACLLLLLSGFLAKFDCRLGADTCADVSVWAPTLLVLIAGTW